MQIARNQCLLCPEQRITALVAITYEHRTCPPAFAASDSRRCASARMAGPVLRAVVYTPMSIPIASSAFPCAVLPGCALISLYALASIANHILGDTVCHPDDQRPEFASPVRARAAANSSASSVAPGKTLTGKATYYPDPPPNGHETASERQVFAKVIILRHQTNYRLEQRPRSPISRPVKALT